MVITDKIKIDLAKKQMPAVLYAMQNDENTRSIEVSFSMNGVGYSLDGISASVSFKKPDGTNGWYDKLPNSEPAISVSGSVATIVLAPQVLTCPGDVLVSVRMEEDNGIASSFPFIVNVTGDPANGGIKSENYYNVTNWSEVNTEIAALWSAVGGGGGGSQDYSGVFKPLDIPDGVLTLGKNTNGYFSVTSDENISIVFASGKTQKINKKRLICYIAYSQTNSGNAQAPVYHTYGSVDDLEDGFNYSYSSASGKVSVSCSQVKTINGTSPDANGNVEVSGGSGGSDGFSPIATVEQTNTGAVITITDKTGTTTATVTNGKDGSGYVLTDDDISEISTQAANKVDVSGKLDKNQGSANAGKTLVVGSNGNLTLTDMPEGGSGTSVTEVFVATAYQTTYEEIKAAHYGGKLCKLGGTPYYLTTLEASIAVFSNAQLTKSKALNISSFIVTSDNQWSFISLSSTDSISTTSTLNRLVTETAVKNYAQPKGDYLTKNQGSANVGKILVVGTDGNLTLTDMPAGGGDVTGTIDENNNILLSGNLASGTYTLKYENQDGTYTEIGTLEVGEIGGYTNLFSTSGEGFANNTDFSGASSGRFLTNYIPCKDGDVIHVKGATVYKAKAHNGADDVWGSPVYAASLVEKVSDYDETVKVYTITQSTAGGVSNIDKVQFEIRSGNTALDSVIITANQDIVD